MSRLQFRQFDPYSSSFSVNRYGYEPSNELNVVF